MREAYSMVWSVLVSLFRSRVSLEAAPLEYGPGPCAESEVEFCKQLRSRRIKIQGFAKRVEGFQQLSPKSAPFPNGIVEQIQSVSELPGNLARTGQSLSRGRWFYSHQSRFGKRARDGISRPRRALGPAESPSRATGRPHARDIRGLPREARARLARVGASEILSA
jgi:hypothetical protein